ncbi:MAG: zinc ABC transporter substrate-binding protein [Pseudomonadota bacterium]
MRHIISFLFASTALALPAMAEVPRVVTDIPPVHALVSLVMGDLGQPVLLLDKGASEHDFQLRPSQAGQIADAGLIVWVGPDLTPWLTRALGSLGDTAPTLALLRNPETDTEAYGNHDDDDSDDADGAAARSGIDPHAWLDPENAEDWVQVIADRLARLDPANAATYAANARAAEQAIEALDDEVERILAPARATPLIMAHDAYGYFADHYDLTLAGAVAGGDASAPGAGRIAELQGRVAQGACLFPEAQHDPAQLALLAEATGARLGGALDPIGSTLSAGPEAYATLMRGMAQTIAACAAR